FFFFSSRRRHTRWPRDWSSDVCSSDLLKVIREPLVLAEGGAEVKSYSAAAIAGLLIVLVPLYSAIASRVSRVRLINGVTSFFLRSEERRVGKEGSSLGGTAERVERFER